MDELYQYMLSLISFTTTDFKRYTYSQIKWENRMIALVGPRGVGKTTLFLQRIKLACDVSNTLYVAADHLYFSIHTLYETAEEFNRLGGKYFFIDEIHKYPNWSNELKMMYDAFPDMHVYFTGSSILDIEKGESDLSRRAPVYYMQGLSFREFLYIRYGIDAPLLTFDQILANDSTIPGVRHPLRYFREYLKTGYYPFGSDPDFSVELNQVIERTLEVDIPQFANMTVATSYKLKKLMTVISTLAPFKPNMTSLGSQMQVSRNVIADYLVYMEKAGMVALLKTGAHGIGSLGKLEKVYLDNTNILFNLSGEKEAIGSVRETFFFNQMRVNEEVTASAVSDFEIAGITFEIGGSHKTFEQIKNVEKGYVVQDGIEFGHGHTLPLWAFGLNY